ncbi:MAG: bifunctional 5,10-methylenetetrahydrofolate dehydrogenase/5,10-methenyltetrahydrofolate cyclohydrolase [Candidatus Ryanbacteria bacterium]|nr:bifunctional 5,10-methylenetetrahydrofolate dehydrogenase/5,10-methenyltetrahydrofolate cyclohydrolase [Candidatus Ryanbacteria bacterium]
MIFLEAKPILEKIKNDIASRVSGISPKPRLAIVMVGESAPSKKFVELKEVFAKSVGIETQRYEMPVDISTNNLRERMRDIVHEPRNSGVIVQLPLPGQIDAQAILNAIIPEKDVDVLSARAVGNVSVGKSHIMPPVAGAVKLLLEHYGVEVSGKKIVVVGAGRLVGQPVAMWAMRAGAVVTVLHGADQVNHEMLKDADIVISGLGKPRVITGEMVKDGVVVVDVGTSEDGGVLVGDVDQESVSKKASHMTPLKGGVGPLTVALVFQNLVTFLEK